MLTCGNCGRESPDEFTFCPACGGALTPPTPSREARKTVTVVFCDVTGSTALGERLDPESMRRVMARYFSEMREALERHGGTVEKFIGDAVMAVFGVPQIHEDDALRAVRAAAEMREALVSLNKELDRDHGVTLAARIGVNTGEVVAGDARAESLVTGDAVNVAARLEQEALPGEVLLGRETLRLVRDAVIVEAVEPLQLKGKSNPIAAYRLVEVAEGAAGFARRLESPMVGRERQLEQLRQAFEASVADRSCQLFTVLGSPGVGKSRLVEEFLRALDFGATVLRGRCLPYGDGITFFPVSEVVKEAAGLEDFDAPEEVERKICAVLGEGGESEACATLAQLFGVSDHYGATEETFWAVRRFLESVALTNPLVVVFDDIHWGEPTFLDLIEHIAEWSRDAPILVLCLARPELLDSRASWGGGKLNAATISLQRLSDAECEELMSNMLGRAALPVHVQARILEAAEGTPLFVEEMLSMLIDDGMLEREDGRWAAAADLTDVPVPPTIQALLAARLDRLGPEERAAIERASVVGKQFHLGAVEALLGDDSPLSARSALMGLVRRDLIGPDRSLLAGDEAFRFRHLLVRDAAYDAIPKATRAELHERFADWLERVAGDRIEEQEEIVGYHLEQVYRLREELGPVDDATSEIGLRAIGRLSSSGRRAAERGDQVAAVSLYRRAVDLCPVGRTDRPRLLFELGIALTEAGVPPDAYSAFDEAVGEAEAAGLTSLHWLARIRRNEVHQLADPLGKSTEEIREELDQAVRVFEAIGDDAALATAWILLAAVEWMPCRFDTAARALGRAVELAGRVGDRRVVEEALGLRLEAQAWGGTAPDQGLEALSAARSKLVTGARFEHIALATEAIYMGMKDELDEARRLMEEVRESAERRGARFWLAAQLEGWGELELYAGELVASERLFREHYELLAEGGDVGHASTGAALLALVLSELHRFGEAEVFARIARETSAADDIASQAMGRSAEARVLSAQGRHDEAISLAREAVRMMEDAEAPGFQAWTLTHCAKVLEAAGHTAEAAEVAREALTLLERKGNVPAARNTRALLDSLGG